MASSTKNTLPEITSEPPDQALDAIGRKYHARMRTVDATSDVYFDPGLGFAKNARQSLSLLANLARFQSEGLIVVGPSRKSFIAAVDPNNPDRLYVRTANAVGQPFNASESSY